jgi:drug/metabolite transporter (DMT)-like permease
MGGQPALVDDSPTQSVEGIKSMPHVPLFLLEAAFVLGWSSGFIGAKIAAEAASVFHVMFWRFVVVSVLLLPFVIKAARISLSRTQVRQEVMLGALALFVCLACSVKAIDLGVPAGIAALIAALQPLATAVLAGPVLHEKVRLTQWLGFLIGLVGVAVAVGEWPSGGHVLGYVLLFIGTGALVVATVMAKSFQSPASVKVSLGIQSMTSAVLFLPLSLVDGVFLPVSDWPFVGAVLWLVMLPTLWGYGMYWVCLRRTSATRVTSLIYLTPPVTMVWAWAMFAEPLTLGAIIGSALCIVGAVLAKGMIPARAAAAS